MNFADPVERLLFLQQMPLLRGLASQRVALLAEAADECILQEGEVLVAPGAPREVVFAAARGRFRLLYEGRPVWDAEAPVLLGLFEALADHRETEIVALEPGLVLRIPRAALRDLVEKRVDIAFGDPVTRPPNVAQVTLPRPSLSPLVAPQPPPRPPSIRRSNY